MSLALVPVDPIVPAGSRSQSKPCPGCRQPQALAGYGIVDSSTRRLLFGAVACKDCAVTLLACNGDADTLERLANLRRGRPSRPAGDLPAQVASFEAEHIRRALLDAGGHPSWAAQALGIHRTTLAEKMRRFRKAGLL